MEEGGRAVENTMCEGRVRREAELLVHDGRWKGKESMIVGCTVWCVRGTLGYVECPGEGVVVGCVMIQMMVRVGSCCWVGMF